MFFLTAAKAETRVPIQVLDTAMGAAETAITPGATTMQGKGLVRRATNMQTAALVRGAIDTRGTVEHLTPGAIQAGVDIVGVAGRLSCSDVYRLYAKKGRTP